MKLTEAEAKTFKSYERAMFANQQMRGADKVLANFIDTHATNIPVIGNYLSSPEYQRLAGAREAWATQVLRDESGAALPLPEIKKKIDLYFAVPGDTPDTIRDKFLRRNYEEKSLADSLGKNRTVIDHFLQQRELRKAPESVPEGTVQQSSTGKRRVNLGGYWESLP